MRDANEKVRCFECAFGFNVDFQYNYCPIKRNFFTNNDPRLCDKYKPRSSQEVKTPGS